jgi:hypothetical protein
MALTDAQLQTLLVLEVGDTADSLLATNVALLWDRYADKALVYPGLQAQYVKRSLVDLALGVARSQVDYDVHNQFAAKGSQESGRLLQLRQEVQLDINRLEKLAVSRASAVVGQMTATAPQSAPSTAPTYPNGPEANDERYAGSPYYPLTRP